MKERWMEEGKKKRALLKSVRCVHIQFLYEEEDIKQKRKARVNFKSY